MNADQLEILCKGLEDAMTGLETMIQFSKTQADRIAELEKFNKAILKKGGYPHKPLSDEEIAKEWSKFYPDVFHTHLIDFVRAIEERHGIK